MNRHQIRELFNDFRYLTSSDDPNTLKEFVSYEEVVKAFQKDVPPDEIIKKILILGSQYSKELPNIGVIDYIKQHLND